MLKCDGTRAETRFRPSAKRTSPFKLAGVGGRQFSRLLAAEVCASALVMLDTPYFEVVWRVLATNCIRQFPLHFPSRASPCAITFQLDSTLCLASVRPLAYHSGKTVALNHYNSPSNGIKYLPRNLLPSTVRRNIFDPITAQVQAH